MESIIENSTLTNDRPMPLVECSCKEERKCEQRGVEFEITGNKDGEIFLYFNFAPYRPLLPWGEVSITFRKCRIILDIEDGEIPLKDLDLKKSFKIKIPKAIKKTTGTKNSKSKGFGMGLEAGLVSKMEANKSTDQASEESISNDESYETEEYQILAGGTVSSRIWELEEKESELGLRGAPDENLRLGVLRKSGEKCTIWAKIVADEKDVLMEGVRVFKPGINKSNRFVRSKLIQKYCYKDAPEQKYRSRQDFHLLFLNCKCFKVEDEQRA
ncbi:hypothetical protein [Nitrosovibrio sp. Nv4]|uniref:hypothetical protein n=1 Tax=Nitrosovibrio sp. Nv4 TaxID=1945880 RepID=UPI000BDCFA0D|nr:hypothetical protein [Nitrosovibrio sp. Nv4]SOD41902.1 hypothetical protein SAMN06298226_2213 [Nitrosovibrio sp. Nv4]